MAKNLISVKTVVAIGIGAALMFVLNRFVSVPTGVPNTNFMLGYAILGVFAALFGPVAGVLIGFIGHTLVDLTWGWGVWWSWVIASGVLGLGIGALWKFYMIDEGEFSVRKAIVFNIGQILANVVAWVVVAPTLDILIYQEPADKVYLQGLVAGSFNALTILVLGTLLLFGYTKAIAKSGSLRVE